MLTHFKLLGEPVELVNDRCDLFGLEFKLSGEFPDVGMVAHYRGLQVTMHFSHHDDWYVFGTTITRPGQEHTGPYFTINDEEDVTCELDGFLTMHLDAMVNKIK